MERWYRLWLAFREFIPGANLVSTQENLINKMFEDGQTPEQVENYLINAMADGVNHGNWPWS